MVIEYLRRLQLVRGLPREARALSAELNSRFAAGGGSRRLYELFPGGPVRQGRVIAGLPVPEHSGERATGTVY